MELSKPEPSRYHKISHDGAAIEALFVDLFLEAHGGRAPRQIILDPDATDDPVHGHQEGCSFHGYYDTYCYLPLYIFCGRHLLAAQAAPISNIDAAAGAVEAVGLVRTQPGRLPCSAWPGTPASSPRSTTSWAEEDAIKKGKSARRCGEASH